MKQANVFKMPDGVFTVERGLRLRVRSQGRYRSWEFLMQRGDKTFRNVSGVCVNRHACADVRKGDDLVRNGDCW